MLDDGVPLLDFRDYTSGDAACRDRLVRALGGGLERFGFVSIEGHGVPVELLSQAYEVAQRTFALPVDVKRAYETPHDGRQRGYTSFAVEHARDQGVADLKEFWHVGRVAAPGADDGVPPNLFPSEVPDFSRIFTELYASLDAFAGALLDAVGQHLGMEDGFLRGAVRGGNSVLRVIHYPQLQEDLPVGAVRAAAHEDINLLTVLPASTRPGLELLTREGRWLPVQAPPGAMICDTGDMMQLLTGGRLPATTHRVVNPEGGDGGRMSMPFFVHPRPDFALGTPDGEQAPITAGELLRRRLVEIGVM